MPINFTKLGKYRRPGIYGFPECKLCGPSYIDEDKTVFTTNSRGTNLYGGNWYCDEHLLIVQRRDKLKKINEK